MISLQTSKPSLEQFSLLMKHTDNMLNQRALENPELYRKNGGKKLENLVAQAIEECARGTLFENSIDVVSGQRFPDIVAAKYFGVEVKSTQKDTWKSTGSSILESTRVSDVERIYMTFGKLGGNTIEFLSKPYENCLVDIAVTHMPRYKIDMHVRKDETIFSKMGVEYDVLRRKEEPQRIVAEYYNKLLKPGERLWWADGYDEEVSPPIIRIWRNLELEERKIFTAYGYLKFPEVFKSDFDRFAGWLTSKSIANPSLRDVFSAGGKFTVTVNGETFKTPAIFNNLYKTRDAFLKVAKEDYEENYKNKSLLSFEKYLDHWCRESAENVSHGRKNATLDYRAAYVVLSYIINNKECELI